MSKPWLRGSDQRRAKREMQVRADGREKFGIRWEPADVRRLALEIAAGEHGLPLDDYQRPGQSRVQVFALRGLAVSSSDSLMVSDYPTTGPSDDQTIIYARYLVEQGEVAGLMTAEEWRTACSYAPCALFSERRRLLAV